MTPTGPGTAARERASADALSMLSPEVKGTVQVLIVDDDRTLREGCDSILRLEGYQTTVVGRGDEALDLVRRRRFDVVLCDLYMTPVTGIEILKATLAAFPDTLFIVMTGNPSVNSSLEALHAGAWDYLPKPFSASHLQVLIGRAAHAVVVARETHEMRTRQGQPGADPGMPVLIGNAPAFRRALELSRKVAATDASVMISGESGTGKEGIAQLIHRSSRRASRQLVPINCAALPEQLLESEMFGHRKGSFTGADRDKPGLLETANGGTLFLDELTEMSLPIQAKLLRVLQDGVVRRVGSEESGAVVDVRFVSATNREPQEAVANGILREDLFYRLRVVQIKLPPLRERQEDIPLFAEHFLTHYWKRHRPGRHAPPRLSTASIDFLRSRPWRGNVRELQNVIENLAVLAESGQEIRPDDIPLYDDAMPASVAGTIPSRLLDDAYHAAKDRVVTDFEREYLTRLVARSGGNMSRAARLAGIDRTTLYRLMERHSMQRETLVETF